MARHNDNLTRRMSQDMENQQVKVKTEPQPAPAPAQGPKLKSRFDNAEYQRWSEKLKASRASRK
jgi:hypothetical protein